MITDTTRKGPGTTNDTIAKTNPIISRISNSISTIFYLESRSTLAAQLLIQYQYERVHHQDVRGGSR